MRTYTLTSSPLLMVVVLAASWTAAFPLQEASVLQGIRLEEQLQEFLGNNPDLALQLYPDLLQEASEVMVVVDPNVVVEMLRHRSLQVADMKKEQQEGDEESQKGEVEGHEEEEHDRRKRQATFGFGMSQR